MCKTYGQPAVLYACRHPGRLLAPLDVAQSGARTVAFPFGHTLSQTCITLPTQVRIRWSLKLGVLTLTSRWLDGS